MTSLLSFDGLSGGTSQAAQEEVPGLPGGLLPSTLQASLWDCGVKTSSISPSASAPSSHASSHSAARGGI